VTRPLPVDRPQEGLRTDVVMGVKGEAGCGQLHACRGPGRQLAAQQPGGGSSCVAVGAAACGLVQAAAGAAVQRWCRPGTHCLVAGACPATPVGPPGRCEWGGCWAIQLGVPSCLLWGVRRWLHCCLLTAAAATCTNRAPHFTVAAPAKRPPWCRACHGARPTVVRCSRGFSHAAGT
jgi:hypothetical protein